MVLIGMPKLANQVGICRKKIIQLYKKVPLEPPSSSKICFAKILKIFIWSLDVEYQLSRRKKKFYFPGGRTMVVQHFLWGSKVTHRSHATWKVVFLVLMEPIPTTFNFGGDKNEERDKSKVIPFPVQGKDAMTVTLMKKSVVGGRRATRRISLLTDNSQVQQGILGGSRFKIHPTSVDSGFRS
jgi:hypothetical protein